MNSRREWFEAEIESEAAALATNYWPSEGSWGPVVDAAAGEIVSRLSYDELLDLFRHYDLSTQPVRDEFHGRPMAEVFRAVVWDKARFMLKVELEKRMHG